MGKIVECKVTDTADYTLEVTQTDGCVTEVRGIKTLRQARHEAKLALAEGASHAEIYACDYFNSMPELVQRLNAPTKSKEKCEGDECNGLGIARAYLSGDRESRYCDTCAYGLGYDLDEAGEW